MNIGDFLNGHGVRMCACGKVLEKCDCPSHQDVFVTVTDSCDECQGRREEQEDVEMIEEQEEFSPSIEALAMMSEIMFNVLGLDPNVERTPRDMGYFLMVAEIQLLRRLILQQEEISKQLKQIHFELE